VPSAWAHRFVCFILSLYFCNKYVYTVHIISASHIHTVVLFLETFETRRTRMPSVPTLTPPPPPPVTYTYKGYITTVVMW